MDGPDTYTFKLVLLGETAVGKSSLVMRFVKDQFHEFQESTIGGASSLAAAVAPPPPPLKGRAGLARRGRRRKGAAAARCLIARTKPLTPLPPPPPRPPYLAARLQPPSLRRLFRSTRTS